MSSVRTALLLSALILSLGSARASSLSVNGAAAAGVQQGLPVTVTVTGTPLAPVWLLADIDPGPTQAFGQQLPLGFSPALAILFLGPIPPGGTLELTADMPFDLGLAGITIYMVAGVADAAQPSQWDWSNGASLKILDRNTQLAGNPLGNYPDFEFVRAFNVNAPVTVAIDPQLHPEVIGKTGKVFVTAKKSRAQWLVDKTLVDVSGGAETVAFSGSSLQANEVVVAAAGVLSAAAGYDMGVGYDVVIDLNQNGLWDGNDLIDGFADEAGLYRVHDVSQQGPLAVTEIIYSGGTFLGQDLYYPTDIANLPGKLPLVTVSHGNGHNYTWYDHIGYQLASYGYIVMSHENNTGPGIGTASTTTLTNNDYLLGHLDIIAGGALQGHLDNHRIMWIGHSRGGEGIARAYDRLFDQTYTPQNFAIGDIKLLSSIAPTDFLLTDSANPHDVLYHLWVGQADSDVSGCVGSNVTQSKHLHDRALSTRMQISLNGVGHGNFHDGGGNPWAAGPCLVGTPDTHTIMRGYLVPLAKHFLDGNLPAEDFLWRQYEHFHPIGAPVANPCVVVNLQYRPLDSSVWVLDDFQTNPSTGTSSSGGTVTGNVTFVAEGRLDDETLNFTWDGTPFNGFSEGAASDTTKGLVIEYDGSGDRDIEWELPAGKQDVTAWTHFQVRACQATRHPFTTQALQDTTFVIELRDGAGHVSSADISVWGGGIEEPYQRTDCGTGAGWANEFETIRVRLSDFTHGNTGLDLSDLASITFRFGPSFSSPAAGRLGIDDLEFTGE